MKAKILRITESDLYGNKTVTIYRRNCFGDLNPVIKYVMLRKPIRTVGFRESRFPSVPKEYGDYMGGTFFQVVIFNRR